uniref:GmrSD restriction endonucleases N-terminal domain-containing protein n=1 Tax=viral metagenome TaxID=1070528 RepID=A0A6C0AMG0_9ZZZZ
MSAPLPVSRIRKSFSPMKLVDLVQDFDEKRITIPPHQREFCWDLGKQRKFIQSILKGYPIPSILLSKVSLGDAEHILEDGRQRITTVSHFRSDKFGVALEKDGPEFLFSQLNTDDRSRIDHENIVAWTFCNATPLDRIEIFDWHQNGAPLSSGERYHAQYASALVEFVKKQLMTPGHGYHDRAATIWGVRGDPVNPPEGYISSDKRRKWLLSAVALCLGLAYGPANANKNYENGRELIVIPISAAKEVAMKRDLERIFEIYEAVQARLAPRKSKQWLNPNWDLGTFTGYILYSLSIAARKAHIETQKGLPLGHKVGFEKSGVYQPDSLKDKPAEWTRLKDVWVNYIVGVRRTINDNPKQTIKNVLLAGIHKGIPNCRNWTLERWEDGYKRVFHPDTVVESESSDIENEDEYDSDEDEESE